LCIKTGIFTFSPPKKYTDPSKNKKVAYLTFDDGPNSVTPEILDILNRYNVKAVFFVVGKNIYNYDSIMRRIYAEGHVVGLHSYTHVKNVFYASPEAMLKELTDCNAALYKTIKKRTRLVRTPYGSKPDLTAAERDTLAENGYRFWDWNVTAEIR
jgi:peptidoglycan/xylan/chitin deacetylase (PgdA/CDA1 family)